MRLTLYKVVVYCLTVAVTIRWQYIRANLPSGAAILLLVRRRNNRLVWIIIIASIRSSWEASRISVAGVVIGPESAKTPSAIERDNDLLQPGVV